MGYLGRRIGLSQDKGNSSPGGADGAVGGGILDLFTNGYFQRQGNIYNDPGFDPSGMSASGGIVNDYSVSSDVYRAHIFTSSGTFVVSSLATGATPNNIEYLVVAGGGGGGGESSQSGGGGAGGFRTNLTGHPVKAADYTAEVGTYTVTVGAGGHGGAGPSPTSHYGSQGGNSEFFPAPVSYPSTKRVRAVGGGGGAAYALAPNSVMNGGSGGGAANRSPGGFSGGTGNTPDPNHPQPQGFAGGDDHPSYAPDGATGGGGGGAGRLGAPDNPASPLGKSTGGYGRQCLIAGPPSTPQPIGAPGPGSGAAATGYFAGGGGGGSYAGQGKAGGYGGGADGGGTNIPSKNGPSAAATTGGGGGGSGYVGGYGNGGNGGSGVVVVRYQIGTITANAKATGGNVSFYNGKTIHTFTSSGTFATAPNWSSTDVEYVVVGGGGAGGGNIQGGGGGAGAYRTGTTPIGAHPVSTTIQVGGGAISNPNPATASTGTPSYFGTPITAPGGGSGGNYPGFAAVSGGSGGGGWGAGPGGPPNAGATGTGDPFPGTIGATPVNSWGNDGGQGGSYDPPGYGPAGGGGAGGAGSNGDPSDTTAGRGGAGIQLPATFRNPISTVGAPGPTSAPTPNGFDTSGKYWVAGGGGGTGYNPPGTAVGVDGAPGGGAPGNSSPFAGGGGGAGDNNGLGSSLGSPGTVNTGGGGGGGERTSNPAGGNGGSGIVLIAYPT